MTPGSGAGVPGSVSGLAMTSLTSASPGLLTSVTGDSGLVHSLAGVSSLGVGGGQQAVVTNNNSLAYLSTTGAVQEQECFAVILGKEYD